MRENMPKTRNKQTSLDKKNTKYPKQNPNQ